ncbi:mesothelin-like protein [Tamandua tetradactyla]|uniref:mesothelin-like protein n=1 Tax=Tamandua tetradactyla TaxID=48850 RepID=UPI00405429C5
MRGSKPPLPGVLAGPGLALLVSLTAHCPWARGGLFESALEAGTAAPGSSCPRPCRAPSLGGSAPGWHGLDASVEGGRKHGRTPSLGRPCSALSACPALPSADAALLHSFWCHPARLLARGPLSALVRNMASQRARLGAWQLSCLANLVALRGLQDEFAWYPPDLLLFYDLAHVKKTDCRRFFSRATRGDTGLLAHLPDQRDALLHAALACLGGSPPRLSASDLLLLGVLVCDMDASSLTAADPHVLQNLQRCPRLTIAQQSALNMLLASGTTELGPPGSWDLEKLQALGSLTTHIRPRLWAQVQEAVGLAFFGSVVSEFRVGRLRPPDTRRFVTSFLQAAATAGPPRLKRGTPCVRGNITAATLRDDLFLVHYDCAQLESCLGGRVLRANLHPLLQHPLPAECQRVVKDKLAQVFPHGLPEAQLRLASSLVYLYSGAEIAQWNITSANTVVALLASDVALENQTEAVLQRFLEQRGTLTGALLAAVGGARLCWMSARQIQAIRPAELRLAGALDVSSCTQPRKDALYAKAREAFGTTRTEAAYYRLMRPYLGGAPVEELQRLAQANVSMDIDTFTSLNPRVLQGLSAGSVATLLGPNVGDLRKARGHPTVSSWLRGLNHSALGKLGLDATASTPGPSPPPSGAPSTTPPAPYTSGLPLGDAAPHTSGTTPTAAPCTLGPQDPAQQLRCTPPRPPPTCRLRVAPMPPPPGNSAGRWEGLRQQECTDRVPSCPARRDPPSSPELPATQCGSAIPPVAAALGPGQASAPAPAAGAVPKGPGLCATPADPRVGLRTQACEELGARPAQPCRDHHGPLASPGRSREGRPPQPRLCRLLPIKHGVLSLQGSSLCARGPTRRSSKLTARVEGPGETVLIGRARVGTAPHLHLPPTPHDPPQAARPHAMFPDHSAF